MHLASNCTYPNARKLNVIPQLTANFHYSLILLIYHAISGLE